MLARLSVLALAASCITLAVACGSTAPAPTTTPTPQSAQAMVLTLGDLPHGWKEDTHVSGPTSIHYQATVPAYARAFQGNGAYVRSEAIVFSSPSVAARFLASEKTALISQQKPLDSHGVTLGAASFFLVTDGSKSDPTIHSYTVYWEDGSVVCSLIAVGHGSAFNGDMLVKLGQAQQQRVKSVLGS